MTNREKKEYLSRYQANEQEIMRLQEELAHWESRAGRVTSSWEAVTNSGGPGAGFQQCVDYIVEYRGELQARLLDSLRLRYSITSAISTLRDARLRQLVSYRYLDGLTITATAEKMNYSSRQVDNLIVSALRDIKLEPGDATRPVS